MNENNLFGSLEDLQDLGCALTVRRQNHIRILNDLFDLAPPQNISKKNNVIKLKWKNI